MSKLVSKSVDNSKSPEKVLEELKNKELELKEQIKQPDSFLRNLYSTSAPKKDVIALWATNLEEQFSLEEKLGYTPTVKSVGHISTYIKSELRSMGVHESTFSYVHQVLGYKYKNDNQNRYKEKDLDDETRRSASRNSSNLIANFERENISILQIIHQQNEFLKNFRNKAKSSRILSALTPSELLQYEETILRIQATQLFASQIIDDRQSVPILAQLKLVLAIVGSTNNFAAGMYVSQIKQYGANKMNDSEEFFDKMTKVAEEYLPKDAKKSLDKILKESAVLRKKIQKLEEKHKKKQPVLKPEDVMTSKQAMKIVFGLVKKVLPVFDHHSKFGRYTRDAALLDGFYGIECPECGSFRVKEKEHPDSHEWLCFCYSCEWWFEAKTVIKCWHCHLPFFEDILKVILDTSTPVVDKAGKELGSKESKCPRCENELILPVKMFEKPKLRGK